MHKQRGFFSSLDSEEGSNCFACGLWKGCKSPKMPVTGRGEKGMLVWAEAPGSTEDERGEQLVGKAGQLLRERLEELGVDLDRDCVKVNSIACRPPDNRTPSGKEMEYCRSRVWSQLRKAKPRLVLLLGGVALESFLRHRWREQLGGIFKWRGFAMPDQEVGAWICPTFHPSYVQRSQGQPAVDVIFKQDLKMALGMLDQPFPVIRNTENKVRILNTEKEVEEQLKKVYEEKKGQLFAFDYETTGLKPYREGHRIACASFCVSMDESYAFMFPKEDGGAYKWWRKLLQSKRIRKTAHNMKFEHLWSSVILNIEVRGWEWCSMQAAHIQDNRYGITGLKTQVYLNFGILPYGDRVSPYLKSKGSANDFNSVGRCPENDLLTYCGLDSLYQYRLARRQMKSLT